MDAEQTTPVLGRQRPQERAALPVSVLIPALNEEKNLPAALESVAWADEVVVVDSGSDDRTVEVAEEAGARVVHFDYAGEGPKKVGWALQNVDFRNEWLLKIDADERITPALKTDIEAALRDARHDGYLLDRELVFMGSRVRCFQPNWTLRLLKHRLAYMEDLGLHNLPGTGDTEIHEHLQVNGSIGVLPSAMRHDDYRGMSAWISNHNRYSTWEARLYQRFRDEPIGATPVGFLRLDPVSRKRVLKRVWVRLPFRPLMRFAVWYFLRRGFRDGRVGLYYCLLMGYYEFTISLKLRELRKARESA